MPEEPVPSSAPRTDGATDSGGRSAEAAESPSAAEATEQALSEVDQAVSGLKSAAGIPGVTGEGGAPMDLPTLDGELTGSKGHPATDLKLLSDVNLRVKVELGRTQMYIEDVLKLNENSVIELDKLAGDPVDIYVNDQHVARGEVLVLNDNFCVRISEVIQSSGDSGS